MGIGRDSRHKRRATGGRMPVHQKKRKFEMARTQLTPSSDPSKSDQSEAEVATINIEL